MKVTRKQLIATRQQLLEEYNTWSHLVGVMIMNVQAETKKLKKLLKS